MIDPRTTEELSKLFSLEKAEEMKAKLAEFLEVYQPMISGGLALVTLYALWALGKAQDPSSPITEDDANKLKLTVDKLTTFVSLGTSVLAGYLSYQNLKMKRINKQLQIENQSTIAGTYYVQ